MQDKHREIALLEEKDIATRQDRRNMKLPVSERIAIVDLDKIVIRTLPNNKLFNWRRRNGLTEEQFDEKVKIVGLAEGIFVSCGPDDPLVGDLLKDGTFVLNEGERRTRALNYLVNSGRTHYPDGTEISKVEVILNPKGTTDIERKRKIVTSQEKLLLTPMEKAYGYLDLKEEGNMSNDEIATLFRKSRQTIDNYISATKLPEEVQEKIDAGEENITHALKVARESKKPDLVMVDRESGEIMDQQIQTIPDVINGGEAQYDRLSKEEGNTPPIIVESEKANDADDESRKTRANHVDNRALADGFDALKKVNDKNQKIDGEMDIEQAIKKMDKLYVLAGSLPNNVKQTKDDIRGLINFIQKLTIEGLDKIKRAPSSVE